MTRPYSVVSGGGNPALPVVKRSVVFVITLGGLASFALSVAAEFTRVSSYQIRLNAVGALHCYYPPSSATPIAAVATGVLFFTQVVAFYCGGWSWARPLFQRHTADNPAVLGRAVQRVVIVLIMDVLTLLAALGLLISAAVENKYHVSAVPYGQLFMRCSLVEERLFLTAAALTAIAAILMLAYYVYAVRANEEMWLANYVAEPVVVDMEAFSRETARTSITAIISDRRHLGDEDGHPGRMAAISHTPVSHARLA